MAPSSRVVASVDPRRPSCCAAVESFVHARHRDEHKRKVSRARSLINNGWSIREEQKLEASRRNVKHERVQDDKFANIERENMRLLVRMQEIDSRREAGGNACKAAARNLLGMPQESRPAKCVGMSRSTSLPSVGAGSNVNRRMGELRRIDVENRRMLKRLQGAKATSSNKSHEAHHQEQQRVMRMRQEHGPKVPGSRLPLPFSVVPGSEPQVDPEIERVEGLRADLLRRVEELELLEGTPAGGASPLAMTPSARSCASDAIAAVGEDASEVGDHIERREYVGGQLPEHSRALVEKMFEEQEHLAANGPDDEDDKDAVAKMLAAASALEIQELDPLTRADNAEFLSYANVVQRSRASLQAANLSVMESRARP